MAPLATGSFLHSGICACTCVDVHFLSLNNKINPPPLHSRTHTHTHTHTHTLYTNIRDSQSAFRCRRHCCRWWPGWKHTPPGTRAWCHVLTLTRWTGCRCCWRSHHSCTSPARCPRFRTPTQRLSLCYSDPAEGQRPTEKTCGTNCGSEMTADKRTLDNL